MVARKNLACARKCGAVGNCKITQTKLLFISLLILRWNISCTSQCLLVHVSVRNRGGLSYWNSQG